MAKTPTFKPQTAAPSGSRVRTLGGPGNGTKSSKTSGTRNGVLSGGA